jgi:hypothetical protein
MTSRKKTFVYMCNEINKRIQSGDIVVLVLLMRQIFDICCCDGLRCNDTHTKFHKIWLRLSEVIQARYT